MGAEAPAGVRRRRRGAATPSRLGYEAPEIRALGKSLFNSEKVVVKLPFSLSQTYTSRGAEISCPSPLSPFVRQLLGASIRRRSQSRVRRLSASRGRFPRSAAARMAACTCARRRSAAPGTRRAAWPRPPSRACTRPRSRWRSRAAHFRHERRQSLPWVSAAANLIRKCESLLSPASQPEGPAWPRWMSARRF